MHEISLQNLTIEGLKFENKDPTSILTPLVQPLHHRSDRCTPLVRLVCMGALRIHRSDRCADRSDRSQQNWQGAHPAHRCATRQDSNLGVSIHHFPPICISADKFDAAGAEIHVRVPWNKNMWQQIPKQLILNKTYPTSGYNLAHIPRHARLLAGSYFYS